MCAINTVVATSTPVFRQPTIVQSVLRSSAWALVVFVRSVAEHITLQARLHAKRPACSESSSAHSRYSAGKGRSPSSSLENTTPPETLVSIFVLFVSIHSPFLHSK